MAKLPADKSTTRSVAVKVGGARARLRAHFLSNIGRIMDSAELRPIAGNTSEWARRVRELRTEEGFLILTHNDRADLKPGQYLLESPKPQPAFARGISKETRAFVLDRNGFTCQMCGAVPWPVSRIPTTPPAKPGCTSGTSSTKAWVAAMRRAT